MIDSGKSIPQKHIQLAQELIKLYLEENGEYPENPARNMAMVDYGGGRGPQSPIVYRDLK